MSRSRRRPPDLLPIFILLAVVCAIGAGIVAFPWLQRIVHRQDCIAVGRVDCD